MLTQHSGHEEYHLGIHYGHNATVAVVKDGRLIFCQSEERLNRIKNSTGFPEQTLEYVYEAVCSPDEVMSATLFQESIFGYLTLKAHNFKPFQYGYFLSPDAPGGRSLLPPEIYWRLSQWRARQVKERNPVLAREAAAYFSRELRLSEDRIHLVKHHLSHAYSAVPNIAHRDDVLIFTLDGSGDYVSATVSRWQGGKLSLLQRTDHRNSIGYVYSAVTSLMGMKSGEHEFKVMGLAPYAKAGYYRQLVERLNHLLWIDDAGQWVARFPPTVLLRELEKIFRFQRFDNIAGAVQQFTEELVQSWALYWVNQTGVRDIAVAGGVFMNVKASQRLLSCAEIRSMFVVPSAADESTAIGAAFYASHRFMPEIPLQPLRDLYLGRDYSDEEIAAFLQRGDISARYGITRPDTIDGVVARLIADNQVVARFSGAMEFGARALGNRSILANPSSFQTVELINAAIKSRDFWMPFTPSILEEDMGRYIVGHERIHAPYMCITFDTTAEARRDLPAAIHPRDHTARPQCVIQDWNPGYHRLISEFKRLTGIGAVLNTSFNLHGEPNVCSPADAIHTLDESGLKYLALGPYLLQKRESAA